ncbi:MAG: hypothetical protein ABSG63_09485 [Spirochaetia bacterium]|jgi:hypothetical protein
MRLSTVLMKKTIEGMLVRSMTGRLTDFEKVLALARRIGYAGLRGRGGACWKI